MKAFQVEAFGFLGGEGREASASGLGRLGALRRLRCFLGMTNPSGSSGV